MQTDDERAEAEVEAQRKRDLRASLERERDGYHTRGLDDRAEQVGAQLRQLGDDAKTEPGPEADTDPDAEKRAASAPLETAVESKQRGTASRGRAKS